MIMTDLIIEVLKDAVKGIKKFDKWVGDKAVEHDVLGQAARQYAARLEDRYNVMRVLGMSELVPLKDICAGECSGEDREPAAPIRTRVGRAVSA